ncbi:MAG: hypothetical protein B7Y39_00555 [Bdellovibrio sp. 28-41-41]|nr:MAG: hypothetical protein B7Y39_00555 [Bdellovibrio sp. 28-41-41]
MIKNLVITSLFVGQALLAAEGDVSTVIKLANTVKSVAQTSEASQENIDEAEVKLREAIELLTSGSSSGGGSSHSGSIDFVACYDFSYQKYYSGLSSTAAADKASAACKGGVDLEITKFLFEKYYSGLSAVNAMDKSAAGSGKNLRGKLTLIKFMYEKYYSGMSSVNAADKAVEGAEKLKKNSLGCLEKLYPNYYSSQSSVNAMNSAVAGCAK